MDITKILKDALDYAWEMKRKNKKYSMNDIPAKMSDVNIVINEMFDEYLQASEMDRETTRRLVTSEMAWTLLAFGIEMATYALRTAEQRYFTNGLLAFSLTYGILDTRELLVALVLYCDAQAKKNLSFAQILEQNDDFAVFLQEFIGRSEENKTLACMEYELVSDRHDGLTYRRIWKNIDVKKLLKRFGG